MSTIVATTLRRLDLERFNLAPNSRDFDCKFLEPGFVSYRDVPGGKLELLKKETIDRCMNSVIGTPLIIGHTDVDDTNRAELEQGVVKEWYFNSQDGWYYVKGTVDTEKAQELIKCGHKPSCGYRVVGLQVGGVDHGIRYDQEISDLEFNHLAIVERPRYAGSDFRLNSLVSNPTNMNVFKFLKKLVTRENDADGKPVESTKMEATEISAEAELTIDGKQVRLNSLVEAYKAAQAVVSPEDALEIDGKQVTIAELADAHRKVAARGNAAPAAPAGETDEQKLAREKLEKETRENGQSAFFALHSARIAPKEGTYSTTAGSLKEKCELGSKRY